MKINYQLPTALFYILILAFSTLSFKSDEVRKAAINYTLYKGKATVNRLVKELDDQLLENENLEKRDFYVTFSECDNEQIVTLHQCDDCEIEKMIRASNRFLILDRINRLPVIFDGDKIHSNYVNKKISKLEPIIYDIQGGESIIRELLRGMQQYKEMLPKLKLEDSDFYITYNECNEQRIAILGYCKGCAFKDLIAATNRHFVIDENLKLPIIFESDRQHSNFFSSDGIRIFITAEGYMVVADKENNVLSKGFTQY
ncbi:MAG: hypothetical protein AB8G11_03810 [Saprospiraceae bacterium]